MLDYKLDCCLDKSYHENWAIEDAFREGPFQEHLKNPVYLKYKEAEELTDDEYEKYVWDQEFENYWDRSYE